MTDISDQEKMNTICFYLIKQANLKKVDEFKVQQYGVQHMEENLGDWEIVVRKIPKTELILPRGVL